MRNRNSRGPGEGARRLRERAGCEQDAVASQAAMVASRESAAAEPRALQEKAYLAAVTARNTAVGAEQDVVDLAKPGDTSLF